MYWLLQTCLYGELHNLTHYQCYVTYDLQRRKSPQNCALFKDELNDFNNISSIYWYINETVNHLVCMSRVEFLFFMNEASLYKAKI